MPTAPGARCGRRWPWTCGGPRDPSTGSSRSPARSRRASSATRTPAACSRTEDAGQPPSRTFGPYAGLNARLGGKRTRGSARGVETACDLAPVDDVPERVQVVGALVLVLEVVGVLPDVDAEE